MVSEGLDSTGVTAWVGQELVTRAGDSTRRLLLLMGPGGYRFGDYWKLGLPIILVFFAVAVGLVPLIWEF